jgi:hypothetical protein
MKKKKSRDSRRIPGDGYTRRCQSAWGRAGSWVRRRRWWPLSWHERRGSRRTSRTWLPTRACSRLWGPEKTDTNVIAIDYSIDNDVSQMGKSITDLDLFWSCFEITLLTMHSSLRCARRLINVVERLIQLRSSDCLFIDLFLNFKCVCKGAHDK